MCDKIGVQKCKIQCVGSVATDDGDNRFRLDAIIIGVYSKSFLDNLEMEH